MRFRSKTTGQCGPQCVGECVASGARQGSGGRCLYCEPPIVRSTPPPPPPSRFSSHLKKVKELAALSAGYIPCCPLAEGFDCPERAMVVIREGVPDESGTRRGGVWCDPCIAPIVAALNAAGLPTVASCCGHGTQDGRISLRDGRELMIVDEGGENDG